MNDGNKSQKLLFKHLNEEPSNQRMERDAACVVLKWIEIRKLSVVFAMDVWQSFEKYYVRNATMNCNFCTKRNLN